MAARKKKAVRKTAKKAARKPKTRDDGLAERVQGAFGMFLRPVMKFTKNSRRAMTTPRTTLDRMKRELEGSLDQVFSRESPDVFISRMLDLIPKERDHEVLAEVRVGIDRDRAAIRQEPSGAALLALYDAADAAGPIAPMMAFSGNPEDETADVWSVGAKLDTSERSTGERKALALLEAVPDLIECIYARHLRAVWALSFLEQGVWPSAPPGSLGALVNQAVTRVQAYPGLVDVDAGHVRNAVAHRHARYVPSTGNVDLEDPPAKWSASLTLEQLEAKLLGMWRVSVALPHSLRRIGHTEMMLRCGMFEVIPLLREGLRGDPVAIQTLADRNPKAAMEAQFVRRPPPPGTNLWFLPTPRTVGHR
jgi:hypothetical protein